MNVSAIIVTRGDVALDAIIETTPTDWQLIVWDNGEKACRIYDYDHGMRIPWMKEPASDLSVYGRYAAIEHASGDLIYVQDDDVIVSDPQAIVDEWYESEAIIQSEHSENPWDFVVANMPPEFRHDFYTDHCLVGFGACFHRDAPAKAFERFRAHLDLDGLETAVRRDFGQESLPWSSFNRTCDVVFTALTPRVLVDVPKTNLWWAEDDSRMWRTPGHVEERTRMLELVRKVRDAA